ncbi:hypothetical protein SFRURICE_008679 [Spodoptera frugiperda]|nr:hypothetical protein SFRURICE_008679 [Spodoptera frugiperda]
MPFPPFARQSCQLRRRNEPRHAVVIARDTPGIGDREMIFGHRKHGSAVGDQARCPSRTRNQAPFVRDKRRLVFRAYHKDYHR